MNMRNTATYTRAPRVVLHDAARQVVNASEMLTMILAPHGGQRIARRNALNAVRSDTIAAQQRAEALASIIPAQPLHDGRRHHAAS